MRFLKELPYLLQMQNFSDSSYFVYSKQIFVCFCWGRGWWKTFSAWKIPINTSFFCKLYFWVVTHRHMPHDSLKMGLIQWITDVYFKSQFLEQFLASDLGQPLSASHMYIFYCWYLSHNRLSPVNLSMVFLHIGFENNLISWGSAQYDFNNMSSKI